MFDIYFVCVCFFLFLRRRCLLYCNLFYTTMVFNIWISAGTIVLSFVFLFPSVLCARDDCVTSTLTLNHAHERVAEIYRQMFAMANKTETNCLATIWPSLSLSLFRGVDVTTHGLLGYCRCPCCYLYACHTKRKISMCYFSSFTSTVCCRCWCLSFSLSYCWCHHRCLFSVLFCVPFNTIVQCSYCEKVDMTDRASTKHWIRWRWVDGGGVSM